MMSLRGLATSVSVTCRVMQETCYKSYYTGSRIDCCSTANISLGVSVDDLDAACKRFDDQGVNWKKRLTDGRMKNVAFILDPDNYWIEVIQNESLKDSGAGKL